MKFLSIIVILSAVLVVSAHKPKPKPRCPNGTCTVPGETKCAKMGGRSVTIKCDLGCWDLV
jgi:hypothetical protein